MKGEAAGRVVIKESQEALGPQRFIGPHRKNAATERGGGVGGLLFTSEKAKREKWKNFKKIRRCGKKNIQIKKDRRRKSRNTLAKGV